MTRTRKIVLALLAIFGVSCLVWLAALAITELTVDVDVDNAPPTAAQEQAIKVRQPILDHAQNLVDRSGKRLKGNITPEEVEEYRQVAREAIQAYLKDGLALEFALEMQRNLVRVTHYNVGRDEAIKEVQVLSGLDARDWPLPVYLQACLIDVNTDFWLDPSKGLTQWQHDEYEWLASRKDGRQGFVTDVRFEYSRVLYVSGMKTEAIAQLRKLLETRPDLWSMNGTLMLACKYDALSDAQFKAVFLKAGGDEKRVAEYADYVKDLELGPQWMNADRELKLYRDGKRRL